MDLSVNLCLERPVVGIPVKSKHQAKEENGARKKDSAQSTFIH